MAKTAAVTFRVAGVTFENRQGYLCYLEKHRNDVYYTFRREPKNQYDKNAIAVIGHDRKENKHMQVGYVPKEYAAIFAPSMDQGRRPRISRSMHVGGQGLTRGLELTIQP